MRNISAIKITSLFLSLLSYNISVSQTHKEVEEFRLKNKKENLRTMFLGAINFCSDTDYNEYLDNPRSNEEYKNGGNCCTSSVPKPYINLSEYYIYAMEGDRSIFDNRDNPFKLKQIRKEWKSKVVKVKRQADSVDSGQLIYKGYRNISVRTYDMKHEQLKIGQSILTSFSGRQGDWYGTIDFRYKGGKAPVISDVPLNMEKAESLFKYFEDNKSHPNLPAQKYLNTLVTYALERPEHDSRLSMLVVNIKKVEFFYPNGWDKKITEISF